MARSKATMDSDDDFYGEPKMSPVKEGDLAVQRINQFGNCRECLLLTHSIKTAPSHACSKAQYKIVDLDESKREVTLARCDVSGNELSGKGRIICKVRHIKKVRVLKTAQGGTRPSSSTFEISKKASVLGASVVFFLAR